MIKRTFQSVDFFLQLGYGSFSFGRTMLRLNDKITNYRIAVKFTQPKCSTTDSQHHKF